MARSSVGDHLPALFEVNERAFAAGQYEVAYHALMAALHAAQDQRAADQLQRIAALAQAQQEKIDRSSPQHPLSSTRARDHGATGIFAMASRQAATQALMARRRVGER
jgi:hypothetical protein